MFLYDYKQHKAALYINTTKVLVIKYAFNLWAQQWRHSSVVIYTDNTTAEAGFCTGTTKGNSIELLRSSLL
jgi:Ca2+/H+ antiporter